MHLCRAYCHKQRIYKLLNHCVIAFDLRKGKTENLSYQFKAIYGFWNNLLSTKARKNPIYFIVYRGWM